MQKMLQGMVVIGHSSRKTTLKESDGSTITVTDSDGFSKGGLVTPNQDTSKKIKGKPTVWNNLYTEMVNNIKNKESTKVQPMTSMVKPKNDTRVTPKQVQSSPTSAINNKVDTLTGSSEAKVQRSKESTKQQMNYGNEATDHTFCTSTATKSYQWFKIS